MKKIISIVIIFLFVILSALKAQKSCLSRNDAYAIYDNKGNIINYERMVKQISKYDICLFGELHNCPISHWMEREITISLFELKGENLIIGGEMWETDQQLIIDEYILEKLMDRKTFENSARLWSNYKDYRALVQFAYDRNIRFIATNIPRRYANLIYKKGENYIDSLTSSAYKFIPPLPIHYNLKEKAYKDMMSMLKGGEDADHKSPMGGYKGNCIVKAQAIKDATMAYFIQKNIKKDDLFIHYNGVFHSKNYSAIYYYLNKYNPKMKVVTISVSNQNDLSALELENNTADFNIVVNKKMAKTY